MPEILLRYRVPVPSPLSTTALIVARVSEVAPKSVLPSVNVPVFASKFKELHPGFILVELELLDFEEELDDSELELLEEELDDSELELLEEELDDLELEEEL